MEHKKKLTSIMFLILGFIGLHAQDSLTSAGGKATGSGGTASYSVGQVVYTTNTGTNGSVAQGVQQVYKISTVRLGTRETEPNISLSIYPNPTKENISIRVNNFTGKIQTEVYDLLGHRLQVSNETTISLQDYARGIYLLKVAYGDRVEEVKVIKE